MLKDLIMKIPLRENTRFKNIYDGQTCFIFGNGASIKYMNLSDFKNNKSIAINLMVLHEDFHELDCCAYVLPESYFFYKYFRNPYDKKFKENIIGNLFRKKIKNFNDINLFTSISNYFGAPIDNTYYFHHFDKKIPDKNFINLSYKFSMMAGGLYAALGVSIYFGFTKAILIGCDYLMTPRMYGHFYSIPRKFGKVDYSNPYAKLLSEIRELIDVEIMGINANSSWLKYHEYTNVANKPIKYRENVEILDSYSLNEMHRAYIDGQFPHKIIKNEDD